LLPANDPSHHTPSSSPTTIPSTSYHSVVGIIEALDEGAQVDLSYCSDLGSPGNGLWSQPVEHQNSTGPFSHCFHLAVSFVERDDFLWTEYGDAGEGVAN
jgi:hypothetical protein